MFAPTTRLRLQKLAEVVKSKRLFSALVRHRVLAGTEHRVALRADLATVIDIGAHHGQFALAVRRWAPRARIISFEPLPDAATVFNRVFAGEPNVSLHPVAIGGSRERRTMHVSKRDDSSSLLPISDAQIEVFPGTAERTTIDVDVAPLHEYVTRAEIRSPAMLKLDVQGFEYEALLGCEELLASFDVIYCECSFIELYSGQKTAETVIDWLACRGFSIREILNVTYDVHGRTVQADLLFRRNNRGIRDATFTSGSAAK